MYNLKSQKSLKCWQPQKGFIEFCDDVDPLFIIYAMENKTIENDFLIVSEIEKCPECGSKLYRDGKDKFE